MKAKEQPDKEILEMFLIFTSFLTGTEELGYKICFGILFTACVGLILSFAFHSDLGQVMSGMAFGAGVVNIAWLSLLKAFAREITKKEQFVKSSPRRKK